MLRDDPSFAQAIEKIVRFYSEEVSDGDLIALNAAVHPRYRGQGLYRLIQQYRQELAKQNHSSKIFLLVGNPILPTKYLNNTMVSNILARSIAPICRFRTKY